MEDDLCDTSDICTCFSTYGTRIVFLFMCLLTEEQWHKKTSRGLAFNQTHLTLWKSNKSGCTMISKVNKNMIIWSTASKKKIPINYYMASLASNLDEPNCELLFIGYPRGQDGALLVPWNYLLFPTRNDVLYAIKLI